MHSNHIQQHLFGDHTDPIRPHQQPKLKRGDPTTHREPPSGYKVCGCCKASLPSSKFHWNKHKAGEDRWYRHSVCKSCCKKTNKRYRDSDKGKARQRAGNFLRLYGISLQDWEALFAAQEGACAICGDTEMPIDIRTGKPFMLAIDHDHATGKLRELLCPLCNNGLGCFKDSVSRLHLAIAYLKKHSS